ncbi:MAG: hypothetical protein U0930_23315 [Pirellulales bacterium]
MSDFLTSLANRSIQASVDLLPMPKSRFAETGFGNGLPETPISEANWNVEQIEQSVELDSKPVSAPERTSNLLSIPVRRIDSREAASFRKHWEPVNESAAKGIQSNRLTVEESNEPITPVDPSTASTELRIGPKADIPTSSNKLPPEPSYSFDSHETVFVEPQPVFNTNPKRVEFNEPIHHDFMPKQSNRLQGMKGPKESVEISSEVVVRERHKIVEVHSDPIIEQVVEIIPRSVTEQALSSPSKPVLLDSPRSPTPVPSETVVNVTIGRIEIRANVEGRRSDTRSAQNSTRTDSLRDFLARRST